MKTAKTIKIKSNMQEGCDFIAQTFYELDSFRRAMLLDSIASKVMPLANIFADKHPEKELYFYTLIKQLILRKKVADEQKREVLIALEMANEHVRKWYKSYEELTKKERNETEHLCGKTLQDLIVLGVESLANDKKELMDSVHILLSTYLCVLNRFDENIVHFEMQSIMNCASMLKSKEMTREKAEKMKEEAESKRKGKSMH